MHFTTAKAGSATRTATLTIDEQSAHRIVDLVAEGLAADEVAAPGA